MEPRRLIVGRIIRPHGTGGEVVVEVLSEAPERFAPGSRLGIGTPEAPLSAGGEPPGPAARPSARAPARLPARVTVVAARPHKDRLLVRFRGIGTRPAADALRGALLSIPVGEAMAPPEGGFLVHQIEGLEVWTISGERIGRVREVIAGGVANDVWVVETRDRDVMIPAIADVVRTVDLEAARITIDPIPGLLD